MATDLETAYAGLVGKQARYDLLWRYYEGDHPIVYNASKLRDVFGDLDAIFAENWCNLVVETVLDRVSVAGFQLDGSAMRGDALAQLWRATGLDVDSHDAHLCALVTGEAFVLCGYAADGTPEAYYNDSRLCHMVYEDARPRVAKFAAKWWEEGSGNAAVTRLTLYYPNATPARLDLGSATRSGLWSPAPLRPT